MTTILAHYGISVDFLRKNGISTDYLGGPELSSEQEVIDAIAPLVPKPCGLPLIRLGGDMDGGYLLPDDLTNIEACFSPGTNNFKRFEDELADKYRIKSYMCDYSSDVANFATPLIENLQVFYKKWLDVDNSLDSISLKNWIYKDSAQDTDLILQIDIEGAEYRNIIETPVDDISRFRIIIMEIHDLNNLAYREFLKGVFSPAINKLFETHICVHVHANNACGFSTLEGGIKVPAAVEATFLRRDRILPGGSAPTVPHAMDQLNVRRFPPINLAGPWLAEADDQGSRLNALEQSVAWLTQKVEDLTRYNHFLINRALLSNNIAPGYQADQSSTSIYSRTDDATRAIDGERTGSFAFHTDIENGPWWSIDFGDTQSLEYCLVFNRTDGASVRADTLELLTSVDGSNWVSRYNHAGRPTFGGVIPYDGEPPLLIDLTGVQARYAKVQLHQTTALHLDQVEFYGRPASNR